MKHLVKSKKKERTIRNNTRKRKNTRNLKGGVKTPNVKSVKKLESTLQKIIEPPSDGHPMVCTSGIRSTTLPKSILAAKNAISYSNENPNNYYARDEAILRIKIADYWTKLCYTRINWRKEKNLHPIFDEGFNKYGNSKEVIWKLEETKFVKSKRQVLSELTSYVGMLPDDDEESELGKEYRAVKKRFSRKQRGLSSQETTPTS